MINIALFLKWCCRIIPTRIPRSVIWLEHRLVRGQIFIHIFCDKKKSDMIKHEGRSAAYFRSCEKFLRDCLFSLSCFTSDISSLRLFFPRGGGGVNACFSRFWPLIFFSRSLHVWLNLPSYLSHPKPIINRFFPALSCGVGVEQR